MAKYNQQKAQQHGRNSKAKSLTVLIVVAATICSRYYVPIHFAFWPPVAASETRAIVPSSDHSNNFPDL